jgi:hypothetical protein
MDISLLKQKENLLISVNQPKTIGLFLHDQQHKGAAQSNHCCPYPMKNYGDHFWH